MPVPLYLSGTVIIFAFLDLGKISHSQTASLVSARYIQSLVGICRKGLKAPPVQLSVIRNIR